MAKTLDLEGAHLEGQLFPEHFLVLAATMARMKVQSSSPLRQPERAGGWGGAHGQEAVAFLQRKPKKRYAERGGVCRPRRNYAISFQPSLKPPSMTPSPVL
jgi:hypothetical protein